VDNQGTGLDRGGATVARALVEEAVGQPFLNLLPAVFGRQAQWVE
jgi:hypothetical protein